MFRFFAVLLRSTIAVFVGLLFAGGTLTLAADTVPVQRPTLVPVAAPGVTTMVIPDVQGQPYVFAKSILQDHGFAWHVTGPIQGYAANTVTIQRPTPGTKVIDTGAPTVTVTLAKNPSYVERGTPENDAPYPGTEIRIAASSADDRPVPTVQPRLEPIPIPIAPSVPGPEPTPAPTTPAPTTPAPTTPAPTTPAPTTPAPTTPAPTTPAPTTPAPRSNAPRPADFPVAGAPKEPRLNAPLPDRANALRTWLESHRQPTPANLNHWLYEHAYIVAGAKFGWYQGAEALQILIEVDKRAETLWGVGNQSRTAAEKALAEVRARRS